MDIPENAVRTNYGHYVYLMALFELMNVPAIFKDYMNQIFHAFLGTLVVVFNNDILIFSRGFEEREKHLRQVLQTLSDCQSVNFSLKRSSSWGMLRLC